MVESYTQAQACFSDLKLDAYRAQELSSAENSNVKRHLAQCSFCRGRQQELEHAAAQFLNRFPEPRRFEQLNSRLGLQKRTGLGAEVVSLALGLAAAVGWLLLEMPGQVSSKSSAIPSTVQHSTVKRKETRTKGSGRSFGFVVKRDVSLLEGRDGFVVYPGDRLRFSVAVPHLQYLAVLSLDGEGVVSEYYPGNGSSERVAHPGKQFLDSSVELDDTLGDEVLYAVFCERAFSTSLMRTQLAETRRLEPPSECAVETVHLIKRSRQ